jgi:hypothetical protein
VGPRLCLAVAWAAWTTKLFPSTERRKARDLFRAFPIPSNNVRRLLLQSVKFQKRPPLASAVLKSQRSSDAELRGLESNYRSHPSFLSQSKLSQTLGLFTSGETLKFMFHRRLPSVLRALLLFDAFFGSCRARFEFTVNVSCAEIIPQNLPEAGETSTDAEGLRAKQDRFARRRYDCARSNSFATALIQQNRS